MPTSLLTSRQPALDTLLGALTEAHCCALVGLSNTGKSVLLRALCRPAVAERYTAATGRRSAFIYVDCNHMFELTDRGLYELVLRCMRESVPDLEPELGATLERCYQGIIEAETSFLVPLNFNDAMTAIIEEGQRDIILLLDEFDGAFRELDGRVFLNLRALKDKYPSSLAYLTATVRPMSRYRASDEASEFIELVAAHTYRLGPLPQTEAGEAIRALSPAPDALTDEEVEFLLIQTGGHPGLLEAATHTLIGLKDSAADDYRQGGLAYAQGYLTGEPTTRSECAKLWNQLSEEEQQGLATAVSRGVAEVTEQVRHELEGWGLIVGGQKGRIFSRLFEAFVRRQIAAPRAARVGIWVDADAGEVWVDGVHVGDLTELEYKLLELLHERIDKLTSDYQIVEAVWGEDYLGEVDNDRIQKLVSRLRAKIEPDPSQPRYLITVRGRGYKLTAT
jgi:hypothetical protein